MLAHRRRAVRLVLVSACVVAAGGLASGPAWAQSKCDATKLKAAGKLSALKLTALSKQVLKPNDPKLLSSLVKATVKARKLFDKADAVGGCTASGDFGLVQVKVDAAVTAVGECDGAISPTQGCVCTVECSASGGDIGTGTGFATDPVQCARLAEAFCLGQTTFKYPNGIAVGKTAQCAPLVDGTGCQCTAVCEGGGLAVDDVTVDDVEACVGLAETGCADLDSVATFDCPENP